MVDKVIELSNIQNTFYLLQCTQAAIQMYYVYIWMDGMEWIYIMYMYKYSTCADLVTNIIDSSGLEVKA